MFEHPETDPDDELLDPDLVADDVPGEGGYDLAEEELYDDDGYADEDEEF